MQLRALWSNSLVDVTSSAAQCINDVLVYNDTYFQSFPSNNPKALTMNVETVLGRAELAQILQTMQQALKSI